MGRDAKGEGKGKAVRFRCLSNRTDQQKQKQNSLASRSMGEQNSQAGARKGKAPAVCSEEEDGDLNAD